MSRLLRLRSATAILLATCATATLAAETDYRLAALEQRVAELESQQQAGPTLDFGSGMQTEVEFYGYIKVDAIYDFGAELGNTTFGLVAVEDDDQGEFFNATAQQTRLGFRTTTPTDLGALETQIEIDFYGDSDYEPRVRHANVELAGFLVGKAWTTFMPIGSYPGTLDFQGVAGIPFARQEQIRYTHEFGDFVAQVALEESNAASATVPRASGRLEAGDSFGNSDHPVGIATIAYDTDPLLLRLAGLYGSVEGPAGSEDVYGINLSATTQLWDGATIDAAYTYGEGIASYLVFLGDDLDDQGRTIEQQAVYLGLTQDIGERLTTRAVYGYRENGSAGPLDDTESLTSLHLNAEYEIVENTTLGIEYFRGTRDTFSGDSYEVDRVQASVQYTF